MKVSEKFSVYRLLAIAGLGGLLYGVDFGVIAAAEPYMKALGVYSGSQISHIVGAVLLGPTDRAPFVDHLRLAL